MKNAIKYGAIIGVLSGIWLLCMHYMGLGNQEEALTDRISWMEYVSIIIPFLGLLFGIKNFRDQLNGGKMEFFEGLFEGFKILIVGAVITAFFAVVYVQNASNIPQSDYMGRIGGAVTVGILLNFAVSLSLMNKQKQL